MCMQQPAAKNGERNGAGAKGGFANAFWEPTRERKKEHLRDLAKEKLWLAIAQYGRENRDVSGTAFTLLANALRNGVEIVGAEGMERKYCADADRILEFIAEESPLYWAGKRAVSDLICMGGMNGEEKVFPLELVSGVALGARNQLVAMYAVEQLGAIGAGVQLKWVAEHAADKRIGGYARELLERLEASDLHASGHGC